LLFSENGPCDAKKPSFTMNASVTSQSADTGGLFKFNTAKETAPVQFGSISTCKWCYTV